MNCCAESPLWSYCQKSSLDFFFFSFLQRKRLNDWNEKIELMKWWREKLARFKINIIVKTITKIEAACTWINYTKTWILWNYYYSLKQLFLIYFKMKSYVDLMKLLLLLSIKTVVMIHIFVESLSRILWWKVQNKTINKIKYIHFKIK